KTSVASLRRLITPTRNADHDQPGTLIIFIGIRREDAHGFWGIDGFFIDISVVSARHNKFFNHLRGNEGSSSSMRHKWLAISLTLTFGMVFSTSAAAQDQGAARGNLGGIVYDASKASVPGAQVTITGPIGSLSQSTTDQGTFLFSTLIPGIYSVKVQKPGFKVASVKSAEVKINKTTSIEVILET